MTVADCSELREIEHVLIICQWCVIPKWVHSLTDYYCSVVKDALLRITC